MDTPSAEAGAIFAALDRAHAPWMDLMRRVTDAMAAIRPEGGWSATDLLLHVAAWKENAIRVAEQQADPDAPFVDPTFGPGRALGIDVDAFNDEFTSTHRDWSRERALAWSEDVHARLLAALLALPPERLMGGADDHRAWRWYWRPGVIHPEEHLEDLRARLRGR
jgi:hypothetical protein